MLKKQLERIASTVITSEIYEPVSFESTLKEKEKEEGTDFFMRKMLRSMLEMVTKTPSQTYTATRCRIGSSSLETVKASVYAAKASTPSAIHSNQEKKKKKKKWRV
jgi:hypothetical protein